MARRESSGLWDICDFCGGVSERKKKKKKSIGKWDFEGRGREETGRDFEVSPHKVSFSFEKENGNSE